MGRRRPVRGTFDATPRVALGVDLAKPFVADVGVNRRGVQAGVSQQFLDNPEIGTVVEHVRGAGVPQRLNTLLTNSAW